MESVSPYPRCPEAAQFFVGRMQEFCAANLAVAAIAERLSAVGIDILTLVDHWILPAAPDTAADLAAWGFVEETIDGDRAWSHPLARFPRVRLDRAIDTARLALAVEDVAAFLAANGLSTTRVGGDSDSAYEAATIDVPVGGLEIVARRGYRGFTPAILDSAGRAELARTRAAFAERPRATTEANAASDSIERFQNAAARIGHDRAVDEFFAAERDFYLTRNKAARFQYERQEAVGIGWANHDHHTYRSSRAGFQPLMQLWKAMGFVFRERFYAGADAGWGAQVLEHPVSRVILFCDVDMAPAELDIDFLHLALEPRESLGTIGLWCALHGGSIAAAGMHHIECEFDFARCEAGYRAAGFGVMKPFTDLPMLKQAFTEPEMWAVPPSRLSALLAVGAITALQSDNFRRDGAAGSHLEILQRWDGFKGFNKTGVSAIIRETDARLVSQESDRRAFAAR